MSSRNKGLSRRDFIKSTTVATLALTGSTALCPGTVRADGKSPSDAKWGCEMGTFVQKVLYK